MVNKDEGDVQERQDIRVTEAATNNAVGAGEKFAGMEELSVACSGCVGRGDLGGGFIYGLVLRFGAAGASDLEGLDNRAVLVAVSQYRTNVGYGHVIAGLDD
jgi:hypothetical protein